MNLCLRRFTLTTSAIVLLTLTGWLDANAFQQRDRIVLTRAWPLESVKIVAVKTNNKANNYGKTINALTVSPIFTADGGTRRPWSWDRGVVLHPAQFAEMVVDKNFGPLLKQAAQEKRP